VSTTSLPTDSLRKWRAGLDQALKTNARQERRRLVEWVLRSIENAEQDADRKAANGP
jgi:hypothetical protein